MNNPKDNQTGYVSDRCALCGKPFIYIGFVPDGGFLTGFEPWCTCNGESKIIPELLKLNEQNPPWFEPPSDDEIKMKLCEIIVKSSLYNLGKDAHNALSEIVESLYAFIKELKK